MTSRQWWTLSLVLSTGILAGGCTQSQNVELIELLSLSDCPRLEQGISLLDYQQVAALRGGQMLFEDNDDGADPDAPGHADSDLLLAIALGPQPTPGYGVYADSPAQLEDGTLHVQIQRTTPPPDAMLAQVITHPCVVLGIVADAEQIRHIEVLDEDGSSFGTLAR